MKLAHAFALTLCITGCHGSFSGAPPENAQAIVGGSDDVDGQGRVLDPAVGMLSVFRGGVGWSCTTTLVAPSVLLTAGHCVRDEQTGQLIDPSTYQMRVGFGLHPDQENAWHDLVGVDTQYTGSDKDIAVMFLAQPITDVTPIPLPPAQNALPAVGGAIRIVGYGVTLGGRNDAGTKRQVTTTFNGTQGDAISVGEFGGSEATTHASCFGDSGGPTFYNGTIIGVTSYGLDQQCLQGSFMTNVSLYLDWVQSEIASHGGGSTGGGGTGGGGGGAGGGGGGDNGGGGSGGGGGGGGDNGGGTGGGVCQPWESEPNDSEGLANAVCAGGDIIGICDSASDVDVYTFTVAPGQVYDVTLAAPGGYRITLYKLSAGARAYIDASAADGDTPAEIAHSTTTGGTYFAHVDAPTNELPGVYYTLHLDVH